MSCSLWSLEPMHDGREQVGNKSIDLNVGDEIDSDERSSKHADHLW